MVKNDFYVYQLIDPRTELPFYVGKGKGDRYKQHTYNRNTLANSPISKRIREILQQGYDTIPHKIVQQDMTESAAFSVERDNIKNTGRLDLGTGLLVNRTAGGEGWSSERKWSVDQHHIRAEQVRDNPRGRPVVQYDLLGVIISHFTSGSVAAKLLNYNKGAQAKINKVCKDRDGITQGFQWRYLTDPPPGIYTRNTSKPVLQYTKSNKLVNTFDSISAAAAFTHIHESSISGCCRGTLKTSGGYVWKYLE